MEASSPVKPLAQAASGVELRADSDSRQGALPNLIVIGAQKCGTSVLHYYLASIQRSRCRSPRSSTSSSRSATGRGGSTGTSAHFDADAVVRGEASPNYTAFPQHQGVPERMASVVPDAKLIYMIRDPLERIAAHWVHNYAKRREKGTLAETLTPPQHLLRDALEVRDAARALPRALPEGEDPGLPAVRASPPADGDAAQGLRVPRRRSRLHHPLVRAGAPPDLGQDARRPGSR